MADPMFSLGYSGMEEVALLCLDTGHPVKKLGKRVRSFGWDTQLIELI